MIFEIIILGIVVGLTSGIPLGPAGILSIKKSLQNKKSGYFTGFGIATADLLFALIASFGVTAISDFLIRNESFIEIIGGLFLIFIGLKEFRAKVHMNVKAKEERKSFFSGFTLALASPFVIFSFFALYATFGIGKFATSYFQSLILALSTFIGSLLGLAALNWTAIHMGSKMGTETLRKVNRVLGVIIIAIGEYFFISGLVG